MPPARQKPTKTRRALLPFTKATIDRLKREVEPERDQRFYFANMPGFYVRLLGGSATFAYEYRRPGANRSGIRRRTIGAYGAMTVEKAKGIYARLYREVQDGRDPVGEERAKAKAERAALEAREREERAPTFADAAALYMADLNDRAEKGVKRGRRSTAAEWQRLLDRHILPALGKVRIAEVDVDHVAAMHRALHETKATADHCLTVASAVLVYAGRRRLRSSENPATFVEPFAPKGKRRERLTDDELVRLGEALRAAESEGSETARAAVLGIRLVALTGMRRSEVFGAPNRARQGEVNGLAWGDVLLDDDHRVIRLRAAKAGAREVPLGRAAADLLRDAMPANVEPAAPVVAGRAGGPLVGVDKIRRAAYDAAGIEGKDLHSLRHTFSSVAADLGVPELLIKLLLGHALSSGETSRYLHPGRDPVHLAADRVAGRIAALLDGRQADVLRFRAPEAGSDA